MFFDVIPTGNAIEILAFSMPLLNGFFDSMIFFTLT